MTEPLPVERIDPEPDAMASIGDWSATDRAIRLACLVEAREQMGRADVFGYADLLYRARLNAIFVLEGTTPRLRIHGAEASDVTERSDG